MYLLLKYFSEPHRDSKTYLDSFRDFLAEHQFKSSSDWY